MATVTDNGFNFVKAFKQFSFRDTNLSTSHAKSRRYIVGCYPIVSQPLQTFMNCTDNYYIKFNPLLYAVFYQQHHTNCYFKARKKPLSDFELVVASFYSFVIYLNKILI